MKTFDALKTRPTLMGRVPQINDYWGHTPGQPGQAPEPLTDHVALVVDYALKLIETHRLEPVIDGLVEQVGELFPGQLSLQGKECLKCQVLDVWEYHDYGKINRAFQHARMENPKFDREPTPPFSSFHSGQGAAIFVVAQTQQIFEAQPAYEEEEAGFLVGMALLLATPIFWHHSGGFFQPYDKWKRAELDEYWSHLEPYLRAYDLPFEDELMQQVWAGRNDLLETFPLPQDGQDGPGFEQTFPLYLLLKLTFSLLTAADYLATSHYMEGREEMRSDFGVLSATDKAAIAEAFRSKVSYNAELYERYEAYLSIDPQASALQDQSLANLNQLRQSMAAQVRQQVLAHPEQRLFYLEAPTGGGKTNLSMLALAEMLQQDLSGAASPIDKVYYVFPFTTLVTQTYQGLVNTLDLREDQIAELHSRVGMPNREQDQGDEVDAQYGQEKQNYLHYLFGHYPITVLTHVRFFNLLKTHRKEPNYQHHRLANSLVIIDELQSYPPTEWPRLVDFMAQYAQHFNMRFVLMSATLPKLHLLKHNDVEIVPLLPNSKAYFRNPNFGQRCRFNLDLLKRDGQGPIELAELASFIHEKSMRHAALDGGKAKPSGSVFAMVEFIFKKRATELAQHLEAAELAKDFDHIFVMSGTILEPRRKEIIAFLKDEANRHKKVLLITTQVVEAGVDIDMDLGFKDTSLVDSDEQLAGRINRNVRKQGSILYLFNLDKAVVIYGDDLRYKQRPLKPEVHAQILRDKDFDGLYQKVLAQINQNNRKQFTQGIEDYRALFAQLNFPEIDSGFKLIDAKNATVFVPLDLPLTIAGTEEGTFSPAEENWLTAKGLIEPGGRTLSGERIWQQYVNLVENREGGFIQRQIDLKRLQAVMSRFCFQLLADSKVYRGLLDRGEEAHGFLYLAHYAENDVNPPIYDYELGILDQHLDSGNFL